WIGLTSHHGERVLELYGKTIRGEDLEKLRWQRQMASEFLVFGSVMQPGMHLGMPLEKSFFDIQAKFGAKKEQKDVTPMQLTLDEVNGALQFVFDPRYMHLPPEWRLQQFQKTLREIQKKLGFPEAQNNAEQYRALDTLATILAFHAWAYDPQRRPNDSYFGGSVRPDDLLDFLIWKHEADRLGIVLTQADVCREINRAWGYGDPGKGYLQPDSNLDANEWVTFFFRSNQKIHKSLTARDLLNALTDEYRVAMAKEAVLGSSSGVRSYRQEVDGLHYSPSVATPDEFYRYFLEQRTALSVSMLPIAVESFVDKVQARPTERDLRNLHERYKNDEASPTRRQPGFKEPRRIKLEYLSYRPEGPFARKLATKAIELLPIFRIGQPASTFAAGGGLAWAASIAGYADVDTAVRALYETFREEEGRRHKVKYDRFESDCFGLNRELQGQRGVELQASTALLGELLGDIGSGVTPLAAPTGWLAAKEYHARTTLTPYAASVLAGASSSPLTAMTLPMRYLYSTPPFEAVRQQMVERFEKTLAKKLMDNKVLAFRKELDKVLASHDDQKRDAFLKKALPEYGLENLHAMQHTQTRQEMLDHPDPALKELQSAWEKTPSKPFQDPADNRELISSFARDMFVPFDTPRPQQQPPIRSVRFPAASGDVVWMLWKSEDLQAKIRPFEDVREEVKKAWYMEQARKLAREKARQINDELKTQNLAPDAAVPFLVQQNQGAVFQLNKVSQLTAADVRPTGMKFTAANYNPYHPPRELIPYPPSDFVTQLLKLKKRGDSLVIADKPAKHFYVAVLMENPQPPERQEFYDVYNQPILENRGFMSFDQNEPLWSKMMADRQRKYARKVLEQLRSEATKDLQDGEYVLPDSVRNRSESGSDTGE
ncbi:MAG: hypothetical protein ACRELG_01190, partial [Gemmataceae bacterium]